MVTVQCPHCAGQLALEPHLAGQHVRCPFCSQPFQMPIPPAAPAAPQAPMATPVQPAPQYPAAAPIQPAGGQPTAYDWHQAAQGNAPTVDTGDDSQRSFAGARYAKNRVQAPSLCLMLWAGAAVLQAIVLLIYLLILRQKGETLEAFAQFSNGADLALGTCSAQIAYYLFVMYGAWKMGDLESHGLSIFTAMLAMIPCSGCCVLGLPLGIWALIVLGDPDVRTAMKTRGIRRY